jgi:DNA-binding MarR family transcriptional regulator
MAKRGKADDDRDQRSAALALEIRVVASVLMRRLRAESLNDTLTMSESAVLTLLLKLGQSTVADLARMEQMTPQSMGAIVASLEDKKLVSRAVDREDARRWNASLTAAGERVTLEMRAARHAWMNRAIKERLDDDEQRQLAAAMTLLKKVLAD